MAFKYNDDRKETGVDVTLEVPSGTDNEIPITNVSFSEEAETSEVQFNDSYSQDIAVTGVTYSGSFETAGRNMALRKAVWGDGVETPEDGERIVSTTLPKYLSSITIKNGSGGQNDTTEPNAYTFVNVLITSHSKDAPADDRTTSSYDFTAEEMYIDQGGG